ncbi:uncharacterized protein LOC111085795 [Limulus polyphemus]|uniref:Uncharacterized protein LOC111085795 n=1 Tax=Limulus polyphemus TaxID=6850 RepID=A0ABM1SDM5_LIMPO|nr:uncharacterized protein LOC111085795 [Limulus polyphemus]
MSQTDEYMASQVHESSDHQKLCSGRTEASFSNQENNDNELYTSNSNILCSIPDKDHESLRSFSPPLEDENPYPDETYSLSDIDKDEVGREDSDKYSVSDIDEELVETIVTSVNPLRPSDSDYTSNLRVQNSPLERASDDELETVSTNKSNGITNSEFKHTENFEDVCLETLNINLMDHKINILDYSGDNETSVDEYNEKGNPVDTFRQTALSAYNDDDDSEILLVNNKFTSMKNTKENTISVNEMTEYVNSLYNFTSLEETPSEEEFIAEILDPPEEFSNQAVVPAETRGLATEYDDDLETPPPLPSTKPPLRPLPPKTYSSPISRRTLPVPLPRQRPPSPLPRKNVLHGTTTTSSSTNKGVLSGSSDFKGRRSSLSSLNTIDDLDQTFQLTIAEAERLLATEDQREKSKVDSEYNDSYKNIFGPFPESDLANRSVTPDKKSSQNIYCELEETPTDLSWKPPMLLKEKSLRKDLHDEIYSSNHDSNVLARRSISSSSSDEDPPPPLPTSPPPPLLDDESDESPDTNVLNKQVVEMNQMCELTKPRDLSVITAVRNLGLENFTINSYKQEENDIYSSELRNITNPQRKLKTYEEPVKPYSEIPVLNRYESLFRKTRFSEVDKVQKSKSFHFQNIDSNNLTKPDTTKCVRIGSFQERNKSIIPVSQSDKLVYGFAGSVRGIRGQVRMRCTEIIDQNNSPPLTRKATSMMDLSQSAIIESDDESSDYQNTEFSEGLRRTKSQVDISQPSSDKESESIDQLRHARSEIDVLKIPISEQEELQEEYKKLQKQLFVYQQQLLDNQKFLQNENIMPKVPLSDVKKTQMLIAKESLASDTEVGKSETLPKRKQWSTCSAEEPRPSTLDRQSRPQPHVKTSTWDIRKEDFEPSDMGIQSKRDRIIDFFVRSKSPNFGGFQNNVPVFDSEKDKISVTKYPMGPYSTRNLSSDRLSKLAVDNEVKNVKKDIGITLRPISQQFNTNTKRPLYKANEQENIAGCSAHQTNVKSMIKEPSLSKQNNQPQTYNYVDESSNATVADRIRAIQPSVISSTLTPQPYKLNSNNAFRLPRVKTSGESVVNEFSQNDEMKKLESKIPPSIIKPALGDNIIKNSQGNFPNQIHNAFSSSRQLMVSQQQEIEPIPQSFSRVVEDLNENIPPVPPPLPQKNCGILSTNGAQTNGFTSHKNLKKTNGRKTSNQDGDVRELLMMEIKQFVGKNALKKVPSRETNWHMRVFGPTSTA